MSWLTNQVLAAFLLVASLIIILASAIFHLALPPQFDTILGVIIGYAATALGVNSGQTTATKAVDTVLNNPNTVTTIRPVQEPPDAVS